MSLSTSHSSWTCLDLIHSGSSTDWVDFVLTGPVSHGVAVSFPLLEGAVLPSEDFFLVSKH